MQDATDVTVVGAGAMGHGLALHCALSGLDVTLLDHRQANLDDARERIRAAVSFLASEGLTEANPDAVVDDIGFTLELDASVVGADIVVESVSEDPAVKREVFEAVAEVTEDAVLASNTSSLSIDAIADAVPDDAHRVAGCHWWYPPYLLTPVEVVRGSETSDETVDRLVRFVERVDRDPILVERDVPGFVWNRVQFAVLRECAHIVETGVASVADVDRAVRDGYALRTAAVGPFETADLSSLSLFRTVAAGIYPSLSDASEPGPAFDDRIGDGREGVAAGAGFHDYVESQREAVRRRDERVAALRAAQERTRGREDAN